MIQGTADYMAVEVEYLRYIWIPDLSDSQSPYPDSTEAINAFFDQIENQYSSPETSAQTITPSTTVTDPSNRTLNSFRYNPLHDVESIWWLVVRLILCRMILARYSTLVWTVEHAQAQESFYSKLFDDRMFRRGAFTDNSWFDSGEEVVHPKLLTIAKKLENMRRQLVLAYTAAEQDILHIDHTEVGLLVTAHMSAQFLEAWATYKKSDVELYPIYEQATKDTPEDHATLPPGTSLEGHRLGPKRPRDADDSTQSNLETIPDDDEDYGALAIPPCKRSKQDGTQSENATAGPSNVVAGSSSVIAESRTQPEVAEPAGARGKKSKKARPRKRISSNSEPAP